MNLRAVMNTEVSFNSSLVANFDPWGTNWPREGWRLPLLFPWNRVQVENLTGVCKPIGICRFIYFKFGNCKVQISKLI
jgi:hypothetical protein